MSIIREIDQMAVNAANDDEKLSDFIKQHEFYILKTAAKISKHYVSKKDDEWSIALVAFSDAVKKYDYDRGSFFSFAELMIHRNLVDYYKAKGRHSAEILVDRIEDEAIVEYNDNNLKFEIDAITQVLKRYGFRFMDLVECSPKAHKTKQACAKAISYIVTNPILVKEMQATKQLPAKLLEKNAGIPRKVLDRHRKYIIAAAEILHGDYPYLSEYLSHIGEGDVK